MISNNEFIIKYIPESSKNRYGHNITYRGRRYNKIRHGGVNRCDMCGVQLKWDEGIVDHILPVSLNGDVGLNDHKNLQYLCKSCNKSKTELDFKMIPIMKRLRGITEPEFHSLARGVISDMIKKTIVHLHESIVDIESISTPPTTKSNLVEEDYDSESEKYDKIERELIEAIEESEAKSDALKERKL